MSPDRRLYLLVVYICAIQLRLSIGGNPRDSAQVSARNAPSGSSSSSGSGRNSSNIACQEDVLDQCPPNASCDKGQCVCLFGYKLNPAYHGKNGSGSSAQQPSSSVSSTNIASHTYCLLDESGTKAASMYGGGGSSSSNSSKATGDGLASGDSSGTADQLPLREPVGAHHILGGVLIPLAFVVILIGSAILAKRTDLWSRLRQRFLAHRNRHRRRPAYEDVVLGNDSDDPPLI